MRGKGGRVEKGNRGVRGKGEWRGEGEKGELRDKKRKQSWERGEKGEWRDKKGNGAGNEGKGGNGGRFASCCCFVLSPLAAASSLPLIY